MIYFSNRIWICQSFAVLIVFLLLTGIHQNRDERQSHREEADGRNHQQFHAEGSGEETENTAPAPVTSKLHAGAFSVASVDEGLPERWEEMTFRGLRPTHYELVEKDDRVVVRAESNQSSSGLILRKEIDLAEFPVIQWTWLVENIMEKGDVYSKDGDDYPARIYVIFDYDLGNLSWTRRTMIRLLRRFYGEVPARAINYIHANHAEVGTVVENPYTDLVKMIVVDSGEAHLGEWRTYRRNIYEDYIEIYGEKPPLVGGLAIMADSDDTGESAVAYFGDICFFRE